MSSDAAPAISILLPTYNGARFLREQVESILNQSWSDFQLLAVDDGSTDGSAEILNNYGASDSRVRVLSGVGNVGQSARLLQLLGASKARLIAFSDQDDIWDVAKLELLQGAMTDHALAFGRSELVDADGQALGKTIIEHSGPLPQPGDRLRLLFSPQVSGHSLLVRREIVTDAAFRRFQMFDWLIGLDAAFSQGITYVDDAVVLHRLHGGNQINGQADPSLRSRNFRPGRLYAELVGLRRRRFNLVERLEHLAHSDVISPAARRAFGSLASKARYAWFEPGTPIGLNDRTLAEEMLQLMEPLAGSAHDWTFAADQMRTLCRAHAHPKSVLAAISRFCSG